jgi:hypothetical protein
VPAICHILAALVLLAGGCARHGEWRRVTPGACAPEGPPRLCVLAGPDAPQVLTIGGEALVPGECAESSRARGGKALVRVRDGRDGRESARRLRLRRGETAMLAAPAGAISVYERRACVAGP